MTVLINQIRSIEKQSQGKDNLSQRMYKRHSPCKNNQDDANLTSHDGCIIQGLADVPVEIHGHEDKEKDLPASK